jgi:hypothetical protein
MKRRGSKKGDDASGVGTKVSWNIPYFAIQTQSKSLLTFQTSCTDNHIAHEHELKWAYIQRPRTLTMSSSSLSTLLLWLFAISLTLHVSADGFGNSQSPRTFDGADPATFMTSSVASVLPDYDKLLKVVGMIADAALEELTTVQTNADEELS